MDKAYFSFSILALLLLGIILMYFIFREVRQMKAKAETISQDVSAIKKSTSDGITGAHKAAKNDSTDTEHQIRAPLEFATHADALNLLDKMASGKQEGIRTDPKTKSCVSDTESTMDRELEQELSALANIQEHSSINSWHPPSALHYTGVTSSTHTIDQPLQHKVQDIYVLPSSNAIIGNTPSVEVDTWLSSSSLDGTSPAIGELNPPIIGTLTQHEVEIFESRMGDASLNKDDDSSKHSTCSSKSGISLLSTDDIKKIKKQKNKK